MSNGTYGWNGHHYISADGHPDLTEALLAILRCEVETYGLRPTARRLMLDHGHLHHLLYTRSHDNGQRIMSGDTANAIVAVFGLRRVVAVMQEMRMLRVHPESSQLVDDLGDQDDVRRSSGRTRKRA